MTRIAGLVLGTIVCFVSAVSTEQNREQLALITKGKLEADLGNYAHAAEVFAAVANDSTLPDALRAEAFVRLGLARSAAGDSRGSLEAFDLVRARYSTDHSAMRFAVGALATGVPGKTWSQYRSEVEDLLRTADVVSVAEQSMNTSSKIVRLKWDAFEMRSVWRPNLPAREGAHARSHSHELAAYEIDKMIGLGMVPPTVARTIDGQPGAIQFWVNGIKVYKAAHEIPKTPLWQHQISQMKLFDNLIANQGRSINTMLVDRDEKLMLVDYEISFSDRRTLRDPPSQFDRRLVEKLRTLDTAQSRARLQSFLTDEEIAGLLARRDALLVHLERLIAERGEAAVMF